MELYLDSSTIQTYLEIIGAIATGLITLGAAWWKFSRWVHDLETSSQNSKTELEAISKSVDKMAEALTVLAVKLDEREKDLLKLEGSLEVQRKDFVSVITSLQKTSSSLDALWRTMQAVYPDKVPRRLSDTFGT